MIMAVITFFRFGVMAAIGELSGRTAAKQIREIKHSSASVSGGAASPITYSFKSQKLGVTAKTSHQRPGALAQDTESTTSTNSTNPYAAGSFTAANETALLGVSGARADLTTLLTVDSAITDNEIGQPETILSTADMTTLLSPEEMDTTNMTTILPQDELSEGDNLVQSSNFHITRSILEVHTQERIQ